MASVDRVVPGRSRSCSVCRGRDPVSLDLLGTSDPSAATAAFLDRCAVCTRHLRLPRNVGPALLVEAARRPFLRLERIDIRVGHGIVHLACALLTSPACATLRALCVTVTCPHRACHSRIFRAVPFAGLTRLRVFFGDLSGSAVEDLVELLPHAPGLRRLALENVSVVPEDLIRALPRTLTALTLRGECVPSAPLAQSLAKAPDLRSIVLTSERAKADERAVVRLLCLACKSVAVESAHAVDCARIIELVGALPASVRTCSKAYVICAAHGPRSWCSVLQAALESRRARCSTTLAEEVARVLPVSHLPELVAAFLQEATVPPTESEIATQKYSQT